MLFALSVPGWLQEKKESFMKKVNDDLRPEYDFSKMGNAVQGKYAKRCQAGTNIIHLDTDVAKVFKTDESVNQALRSLIQLAKDQTVSVKGN